MGQIDLSLPADISGHGSRRRAHLAVQSAICPNPFPMPRGRGANGIYQLHHAIRHLHALLLRLWIELFCRIGVLSNLLRCLCRLDRAVDRQPALAAVFPLRPARMGVAESDLLDKAAILAAGITGICRGFFWPGPPFLAAVASTPARPGPGDP